MPVRKRGERWYYDFSIKGRRYKAAVPEARTKAEAVQAETAARASVFQGTYGLEELGRQLFSEFVEKQYLPWARVNKKSWKNDEYHAQRLSSRFQGKQLREVSPLLIEKLKRDLANEKTIHGNLRAPASVNHVLTVLSGVFTLAVSLDQAATNPCRKVRMMKVDNQQYRYLTWDEEGALLAVLNDPPIKTNRLQAANEKVIRMARSRLRDAIQIAVGTGLREGEQLRLMAQHCDFDRNVIIVTHTKTSRNREVPMNDDVRAILARLCRGRRRDAFIFINPKTKEPFWEFGHAFKRACADAGIEDITWRDLRATFGTRLGEAGYNAFEIAALLGHTNISTTQRYVRVEPRKHEAVQATMLSRRAV